MSQESIEDEVLSRAVDLLGEHFDSVQIICTSRDANDSDIESLVENGCGSLFARVGSVRHWLVAQEAHCMKKVWDSREEE